MNAADFVNATVGREWDRKTFNCFHAVALSFKEIDGVDLPSVNDLGNDDLAASEVMRYYRPCEQKEGAIFNCYDSNGNWVHVGRVLLGQAYHATTNGSVCMWDLDLLERYYQSQGGHVRYCEYATN